MHVRCWWESQKERPLGAPTWGTHIHFKQDFFSFCSVNRKVYDD